MSKEMREQIDKVKNWKQFINESENKKDYNQLYENVEFLKQIYNDYKQIFDFFINVETHIYGSKQLELGLGFCNDTKTNFQPIFKDILNYLINNNFNINIEELEKNYKTLYFSDNINRFVNYIRERPYKKYYYYQTIKKISFGKNSYTPEEKIQYIVDCFNNNELSKKYDINIDSPVSFINVKLIEK
jgi:hypothetical protein